MRGIIFDTNLVFLRDISGDYANGLLKWQDGNIFNKVEKSAPIDFSKRLPLKDQNAVLLMFDGKDYKQIVYEDLNKALGDIRKMKYAEFLHIIKISELKLSDKSIDVTKANSDFVRDQKIVRMVKQQALTKPRQVFKDVLDFLHFALIIFAIFGIWYMVGQSANNNAPTLHNINATLGQNQIALKTCFNQSAILTKVVSLCESRNALQNTTLPKTP